MLAVPLQLHDGLAAFAPVGQDLGAPLHEELERVRGEADLAVASRRPEEHQTAADFNARRLLSEVTMLVHPQYSCAESEQEDNGLTFDKGKDILRPVSGRVS